MPQPIDNQWRVCPKHHYQHDRFIDCPFCVEENNKKNIPDPFKDVVWPEDKDNAPR